MRKLVFLAFSGFLISHAASARDVMTLACPDEFPIKAANNKSLPLTGMEVWDGIALMEPDEEGGARNTISGDGHWEIRCTYDKQYHGEHQITLEIPKGSRYCTGTGHVGGKLKMFCMGPKEAVPTTPPPMFISQPVDYTTTFHGFGLRQTEEQIMAEAQRQGFAMTPVLEPLPDGRHRLKMSVAAPLYITVWLSPQTRQSIEVRQDFPSQNPPSTGNGVIGTRLFGDFNDFILGSGLVWDHKTGVIVISQETGGSSLRLIDDAEISKETGQPLGYKKYAPK